MKEQTRASASERPETPKAHLVRYLREIAALTSGNRQMYRDACKDAADEIERLNTALQKISNQDFEDGLGRDATVLSGFAWSVLAPES